MIFPSLFCVLYSMSWVIWNWCVLQLSRLGLVPPGRCLHPGDGWVDPAQGCVVASESGCMMDDMLMWSIHSYATAHKENTPRNFLPQPRMQSGNTEYSQGPRAGNGRCLERTMSPAVSALDILSEFHHGPQPLELPIGWLQRQWWYWGDAYMMKTYY